MYHTFIEYRREERFPYLKTIGYACDNQRTGDVLKAITINISRSGMCLYLYDSPCAEPGEKILIKSDLPVSSQRGTIKWVEKVDDGFYRAGLKFA